jgi:hypothetical protein
MSALKRLMGDEPYGMVRLALGADAAITGANGVAYLAGASLLDGPLGVEASTLRPIGAFLIVFAAIVGATAASKRPSAGAVGAIVIANVAWAVGSVAVLAAGSLDPTTGGGVWIALQAIVVGGFAGLQAAAYRRVGSHIQITTGVRDSG